MVEYKYFNPKEIINLQPKLVGMLDEARGRCNLPFVISSGYRTVRHNADIGGVSDSAHLTGEAADVLCTSSRNRMIMLQAFIMTGFTRIGIYGEHFHVDISKTLPGMTCWVTMLG